MHLNFVIWNVEISLHFNFAFLSVLLFYYQAVMGKVNFHGY